MNKLKKSISILLSLLMITPTCISSVKAEKPTRKAKVNLVVLGSKNSGTSDFIKAVFDTSEKSPIYEMIDGMPTCEHRTTTSPLIGNEPYTLDYSHMDTKKQFECHHIMVCYDGRDVTHYKISINEHIINEVKELNGISRNLKKADVIVAIFDAEDQKDFSYEKVRNTHETISKMSPDGTSYKIYVGNISKERRPWWGQHLDETKAGRYIQRLRGGYDDTDEDKHGQHVKSCSFGLFCKDYPGRVGPYVSQILRWGEVYNDTKKNMAWCKFPQCTSSGCQVAKIGGFVFAGLAVVGGIGGILYYVFSNK